MNTTNPTTPMVSTANTPENKQILLKDIGSKWSKFSEQELGALTNKDELVNHVVAKYSIDKSQATRDVDAVMKGRQF